MFRPAALLCFLCLICSSNAQPVMESLAKNEMQQYAKLMSAYAKRSNPGNTDIVFAELNMRPDMNTGEILEASVKYIFMAGTPTDKIEFDLRRELTVDSIKSGAQHLAFVHGSDEVIRVVLTSMLPAGGTDSLRIYYHGKPDMSTRAYTRSVTASGASVSTLSEPYGAHYWWPCRENLQDKIDSIDINLTVDTPYTAVANGKLVAQVQQGKTIRYSFRHRYPIATYLVAASFARYNFYIQQAHLSSIGVPLDIRNYVFSYNDMQAVKAQTAQTISIIQLYDSLFGTYPFYKEHYGHTQFTWGGGMEHQTMSFVVNFGYDLIAHELAHQWFGDKITCGTWRDIWLNEGFATYSNLLCYNFLKTRGEWIGILKQNKEDVLSQPDGSVFAKDTTQIGPLFDYRTTYQKGALVLHQLRWLIGDNAFFEALRKYQKDTNLAYGFARQDNLKFHFEQESGMDLGDYFNDWINREGYPIYNISWSQSPDGLKLVLRQSQSHPSVPLFNVPVPLLVKGQQSDSLVIVPIGSSYEEYTVKLPFKVREVIFDPDEWLLARAVMTFPNPSLNMVTLYPNPSNGILNVSLDGLDMDGWELIDACGRVVISRSYSSPVLQGNIEKIDCNSLANGVYLIRITGNGKSILRRIIKN